MDLGLQGRVALVGGSSRGLGYAIAHGLAAEGCRVLVCSRDAAAVADAAARLRSETGAEVASVTADLSTAGGTRAAYDAARALGPVDVLVTNTGGPPAGRFEDHADDRWDSAVTQHLHSVRSLAALVLPEMRERGWGRIITITSIAVKQPVEGLILSNTVRAAVAGLARTLANEVARDGITVNNVMPGYTRTERLVHLAEHNAAQRGTSVAEAYGAWEKEIPMGRLGEPPELAALVVFLASARASYITGASIAVDGGWIRSLL